MPSLPDSSLQTFLFITCTFSPNLLYHYLNLLHSDFWLSAIPLYFSKKFKEVLSGFLISTYVSALFGFTLFYLNLAFRNHEIGSYNGSYNWFIQLVHTMVHTMVLWCKAQRGSPDHIFFPLPREASNPGNPSLLGKPQGWSTSREAILQDFIICILSLL